MKCVCFYGIYNNQINKMKKLIVIMAAALLLPLGMNAQKETVKNSVKAKTTKVMKAVKLKKAKKECCATKSDSIVIKRAKDKLPIGAQPQ